jgi:hypothetical protein
VILYHFTSLERLPEIKAADRLTTTESNLSNHHEHAGPDVVWLTSDADIDADEQGLAGTAEDKTAVRITVDVPDSEVQPWLVWSRKRGITPGWALFLEEGRRASSWYVVQRTIPASEWVDISVLAREA